MDIPAQDSPTVLPALTLEDIIKQVEAAGVNLGNDPAVRINSFIEAGLIPRPINGRFPSWVIQRVIAIQDKLLEGKTLQELSEEVGRERRRFLSQVTDLQSMVQLYKKFSNNSLFMLAFYLTLALAAGGFLASAFFPTNPVVVAGKNTVKAALDSSKNVAKTAAAPVGKTLVTIIKTSKPTDSDSADPLGLTNLEAKTTFIPENLVQLDEFGNLAVSGNIQANNFAGSGVNLTALPWTSLTERPSVLSAIDGVSNDEGNIDLVAGSGLSITPDNETDTITFGLTTSIGNADTLDSLDSLQFLRSDISGSFTSGRLTIAAATTLSIAGSFSCTNCVGDAAIPNTITAANYLPLSGGTMSGNIDFANNLALNIGAAGTDFTSGGGLNIADDLDVAGHAAIGASASVSTQAILFLDETFSTAITYGLRLDVDNSNLSVGYGINSVVTDSSSLPALILQAGYFESIYNSAANLNNLEGVEIVLSSTASGSGFISNAQGLQITGSWAGSAPFSFARGIYISGISGAGTPTVYGLHIDSLPGTTVYPIYQGGSNGSNVLNANTVFGRTPAGNDTSYGVVIQGALCVDDGAANCPAGPTAGAIYVENSVGAGNVSAFDIAEYYPAAEPVEKGDVVVATGGAGVGKSSQKYDHALIGVVSTDPAFVIDETNITFGKTAGDNFNPLKPYVALAGRVPTKVSTENGPIAPGDPLTSSSTPGVAMKATKSGPIVGKALEALPTTQEPNDQGTQFGKIMVFVSVGWYVAPLETSGQWLETSLTGINVATLTAGTISTDVLLVGDVKFSMNEAGALQIDGDVSIAGDLTVRNLIVLDEIKAPKVLAEKINVDTPAPDPDTGKPRASIGTGTIVAGSTKVVIETMAITKDSRIFVTPTIRTNKVLSVTGKVEGTSFTVEITETDGQDIQFNWWVVN